MGGGGGGSFYFYFVHTDVKFRQLVLEFGRCVLKHFLPSDKLKEGSNLLQVHLKGSKVFWTHHQVKKRRMDNQNSTDKGVIIMVPVHSDDFRKINELVESAWICREPDKKQDIKDTRLRLLQEHNTEILEAATTQLQQKSGNSSKS